MAGVPKIIKSYLGCDFVVGDSGDSTTNLVFPLESSKDCREPTYKKNNHLLFFSCCICLN